LGATLNWRPVRGIEIEIEQIKQIKQRSQRTEQRTRLIEKEIEQL
jgi:hypothetical protein